MKKIILVFCTLIIVCLTTLAQDSKIAVGVRITANAPAITSGFTVKYFLNEKSAIEGMVGINNGFGIGGLYELHFPIEAVNNLQWFAGAGAYVAFRQKTSAFGAAGIIGLDYKFNEIPLNVSLDWKPELNILTKIAFEASGIGFSVRYTF